VHQCHRPDPVLRVLQRRRQVRVLGLGHLQREQPDDHLHVVLGPVRQLPQQDVLLRHQPQQRLLGRGPVGDVLGDDVDADDLAAVVLHRDQLRDPGALRSRPRGRLPGDFGVQQRLPRLHDLPEHGVHRLLEVGNQLAEAAPDMFRNGLSAHLREPLVHAHAAHAGVDKAEAHPGRVVDRLDHHQPLSRRLLARPERLHHPLPLRDVDGVRDEGMDPPGRVADRGDVPLAEDDGSVLPEIAHGAHDAGLLPADQLLPDAAGRVHIARVQPRDFKDGLSDRLFRRPTEDALRLLVPADDPRLRVGFDDRQRRPVQGDVEVLPGGRQRVLHALPVRDVLDHRQEAQETPRLVPDAPDVHPDPDDGAVLPEESLLQVVLVDPAVADPPRLGQVGLQVLRMREIDEGEGRQLLGGIPEDLANPLVDLQEPEVGGKERRPQRRLVEEAVVLLLLLPERVLRPLPLGDVERLRQEGGNPPPVVVDRRVVPFAEDDGAVPAAVAAHMHAVRALPVDQLLREGARGFPVLFEHPREGIGSSADHLLRGPPQHALRLPVPADDVQHGVRLDHRDRGIPDQGVEVPPRGSQVFLDPPPLGGVRPGDGKAVLDLRRADVVGAARIVPSRERLGGPGGFHDVRLPRLHRADEPREPFRLPRRREQLEQRPPEELVAAPPDHPAGRLVDVHVAEVDDPPLFPDRRKDHEPFGEDFHGGADPVLVLPERRLHLLSAPGSARRRRAGRGIRAGLSCCQGFAWIRGRAMGLHMPVHGKSLRKIRNVAPFLR